MSITVEEAVRLITENITPLGSETVNADDCLRRVLSEDVCAAINQPPFPRSPLDGYAVRSADIAGASKEHPVTLKVIGKFYAGQNNTAHISEGECTRIMTGSMLPAGADCVIKQELSDYGEDIVTLYGSQKAWDNYVFEGEYFKKGDIILKKGTVLDAPALAIAAESGYTELPVYKKLRAAILCTGDELCVPGAPLEPGKIYNASLSYLKARLREFRAECVLAEYVGDDTDRICDAIIRACECADLIITTGGVSVGQHDLIPAAMEKLGAEVVYHGVRMKPGMPTMYSVLNGKTVLSLSGNPFAAAVAFELIAKPFIRVKTQNSDLDTVRNRAVLATPFGKKSPGRRFIRGKYKAGELSFPEGHSNGQMSSMVGCNCLADIPGGTGTLEIGDEVEVIML